MLLSLVQSDEPTSRRDVETMLSFAAAVLRCVGKTKGPRCVLHVLALYQELLFTNVIVCTLQSDYFAHTAVA